MTRQKRTLMISSKVLFLPSKLVSAYPTPTMSKMEVKNVIQNVKIGFIKETAIKSPQDSNGLRR